MFATSSEIMVGTFLVAALLLAAWAIDKVMLIQRGYERRLAALPAFDKRLKQKQEADRAQLRYAAQFGADLKPLENRMMREDFEMFKEFCNQKH